MTSTYGLKLNADSEDEDDYKVNVPFELARCYGYD